MAELDTIIENGLVVSENETKKLNIGIKEEIIMDYLIIKKNSK